MNGKYVVVTGASSGIGYETAKAFANRGKNLIICARRAERLLQLKEEIQKEHTDIEVVVKAVDLSNEKAAIDLYRSLSGYDIEVFVNNAGLGNDGDITNPDLEHNISMIHVNVNALALLSMLYVADYKDTEGAQLINVASSAGYMMFPGCTLYGATKFFVSSLTEGIDTEMKSGGHRLRAKVLAPGATETEFEQAAHESAEHVDYAKKFHRYHTAEQMAEFLLKLYDSDKTVGEINFLTFSIRLTNAKHPALKSKGVNKSLKTINKLKK